MSADTKDQVRQEDNRFLSLHFFQTFSKTSCCLTNTVSSMADGRNAVQRHCNVPRKKNGLW